MILMRSNGLTDRALRSPSDIWKLTSVKYFRYNEMTMEEDRPVCEVVTQTKCDPTTTPGEHSDDLFIYGPSKLCLEKMNSILINIRYNFPFSIQFSLIYFCFMASTDVLRGPRTISP